MASTSTTSSKPDRPFVRAAKVETMRRDFNRLRKAIRAHDHEATEEAWEMCERWVDQLRPEVVR